MRSLSFPLLPKAMFAFLLLDWHRCLGNSANMRSRLRLQTPRRWGREKNPLPCLHALTSAVHLRREYGRLSPRDVRSGAWKGNRRCGHTLAWLLSCPLKPRTGQQPLGACFHICNIERGIFSLIGFLWRWNVLQPLGVCWAGWLLRAWGTEHAFSPPCRTWTQRGWRTNAKIEGLLTKFSLPRMFVNKLLLASPHTCIDGWIFMAAFTLPWQSGMIATVIAIICKVGILDNLALYRRLPTPEPDQRMATWHSELYMCFCQTPHPFFPPHLCSDSSSIESPSAPLLCV